MARQPTPAPGAPQFKAKQFGELIKQEREQNGWTQAELARRAGLAKQVVSNIERGSVIGSINTLAAVAHALDLPMHDIINVGFGPLTHQQQVLDATVSSLIRKMKPENQKLALKQLNAILTWQKEKS
jgi:transcriptional regulator with XRE-family HTH domain